MKIDTGCPNCGGVAIKESERGDDPVIYKCPVCNSVLLPDIKKSEFRRYFGWIALIMLGLAFALGKLFPTLSLGFFVTLMLLSLVGTGYEVLEFSKIVKLKCVVKT
ncbi:hypothetical protein ACJJI4_01355 [Microbulbifer sp. TRSA002]|uniref:hypothetical protein n=1 Tax=Microbulbifer sp. TRSA002 TaxID=3243382 RepID=UPI00403941B1